MQSYCIYAEAFAGPFRPLRAPEPPFTHKTPPFTQVLFLFDAFYGILSSRKSSSLCSYKTESEAPMKKRILALLLAFSMMLSLLPVSALADTGGGIDFAAYASNGSLPALVMDNDTGKPDLSSATQDSEGVYQGDGWTYEIIDKSHSTLTLKSGSYNFNNTKPTTEDGETLKLVKCKVVVESGATITGGGFHQMLNYGTVENSLLVSDGIINRGGTMTNCLFRRTSLPEGVANYHKLTEVNNSKFEATLPNAPYTFSDWEIYYFTGTPTLTVKVDNNPIQYINGEEHYGHLTDPDGKGYQTFTPKAGDDVVLNRKPYVTDLVMTTGGFPVTTGREPIYDSAKNVIGCKGEGWKYENDTLTLESGEYDFNYTKPKDTASERYSYTVECSVVVNKGAAITGGKFSGDTFSNSGTVKDVLIKEGQITNTGTLSCLFGLLPPSGTGFTRHTMTAVDGSKIYYTVNQHLSIGGVYKLYFTGTPKFTVKLKNSTIHYINGEEHYGGLTSPDGKGYQTFTPPEEEDIVLNREPYATDLVMTTDGIPDITNVAGGKDGTHFSYKGDGWTFTGAADIPDAIGTLTLNKNTNSYDFRYLDPLNGPGGELAAVKCPLMNNGATIENGVFKNLVINHSGTIRGGTFAVGLFSINSEDFVTSGTVTGGAFNGKDGLSDGAHAVTVNGGSIRKVNDTEPLKAHEINDSYGLRYDIVQSTEWNLYSYEGTILTVTADTDITNINGWDVGKFTASSYPNGEDDKKTVSFQMPDGPVVLNDTLYTLEIIRGTMMGNTSVSAPAGTELKLDADEPAKNETFLGWTLSDESLLTSGTLNDPNCKTITITMKNASATAEAVFQKDTPAYTLTVTGGGLVNGKTSAVVEAGDEVRLTVGEMQEGMSFNYWDLPTALTKALMDKDSTFSNKVENLTFTMPDLSEYTEDKSFTIRLDIRPAELPDDDDGPSVLGTMATVAVGGAAAGILVWQGVSLGVDSYLQLSLPGGVPVPANRIELVKLLWETAGKPDVVLPALYGDVSAEDGELQKATRWAINNGLVKSADESDASRFDPDRSVSKYEVARAWFKVQQMLK